MSTPLRDQLRRYAPYVMGAFLITGLVLFWPRFETAEVSLSFRLSPVLRAEPKSVRRHEVTALEALVDDSEGQLIARIALDFPQPLSRPITNPAHLRAPTGDYVISVTLRTADGRSVLRTVPLEIKESGPLWVELD